MSAGEIFIIDDNPNNVNLLASLLREHGYEVRMANNGRRALAAVGAAPPDLIMLDIRMPEMDGYEVCFNLKDNEATAHIPVIFISALDDVFDKVKAFKIGGCDYLTKPFEAGEVLARVECQIALVRLRRELESKNQELAASNRDLAEANLQLDRANRALRSLSYLDALTGIPNRRHFDDVYEQEWRRTAREAAPMSVIMLDIDLFKKLNDAYGHQYGDECLVRIASTLGGALRRAGDLAARYGGEEFVIVLPGAEAEGASRVAETVRERIAALQIAHEESPLKIVTASLGVATVVPREGLSPEALLGAADSALYEAKRSGRNRVCVGTSQEEEI